MTDDNQTTMDGWWVHVSQFWKQTLLPHTGSLQYIRAADGKVMKGLVLSGRNGWVDGNYEPIENVTEWLKPARWFWSEEDIEGKHAGLDDERNSGGSVLRSVA